jgi:ferrochelatase
MAHGTPSSVEEIGPFLTRIRHGRPPEPAQLAELTKRYECIGGLSPLAQRTDAQVAGVRRRLQARAPGRYEVAFGAKHAAPSIEDAAIALENHERMIGLVLTPHSSSMGSEEYLERAHSAAGPSVEFVPVRAWADRPTLVALLADRVRAALASVVEGGAARPVVVFTAHSLPERIRERGDTYPDQLATSARLVAHRAGLAHWEVAWQSAPAGVREPWLGPDVRDLVRRLAGTVGSPGPVDAVVVCPIGFVSDHLEVLYDLDVDLAGVAGGLGLGYARTVSLNDDPAFLDTLADVVREADSPPPA